ncbi:Nuclear receptor 2C2-associated protein [Podila humilis]|nr:Nuclear receptor 2C2-associated protein [Podila humilis]
MENDNRRTWSIDALPFTADSMSSVLNRETTLYGKQFLTDNSEETCWNSEAGTPQFIVIDFGRKVNVETCQLMFQGGFVGKTCRVQAWTEEDATFVDMTCFYPDDINPLQSFAVPEQDRKVTSRIKLIFESSTDFFGRITVYKLDILGTEA